MSLPPAPDPGASPENVEDLVDFPFPRETPLALPSRYRHLREHEPVSKVRIWSGDSVWLISRHEDGREFLKKTSSLTSDNTHPRHPHQGPGTSSQRAKKSLVSMDPPEHTHFRQLIASEFTVSRVEKLRPEILKTVAEQIDHLTRGGPPMNLVTEFCLAIPSKVTAAMLGVPYEDHGFFQENTSQVTSGSASVEASAAAVQRLWDYLADLMRRKQATPSDDLMSRVAVHVTEGRLEFEATVNLALVLLIGGHETSAHQMALGILLLLEHPEQLNRLRSEPALIKNAVEEILRFVGVTQAGRRRVTVEPVEVAGQIIPTGEPVIVAGDSGNMDRAVFDEPERFDITRENASLQVTFGSGIHQCIGHRLARAELEIGIAELFRRLPGLRLAVPFDDLGFREGAVIYGLSELPVTW